MKTHKRVVGMSVVLMCISLVSAAVAITGEWAFRSKFEARTSTATMTITKNAEDKYEGTWSAQWGESRLSDITFVNGSVKFTQTVTFGDNESKTTYEGTVEGGKLTGKGTGRWGDFTFEGTLQGQAKTGAEAICGQWDITITIPAREIVDKMTITKNDDGSLAATWTSERGENTISDVNFEDGKLTFTRTSKFGNREWESRYEGTLEGDEIKGAFSSDRGEREVNATRVVSSEKAEPKKPASEKNANTEYSPT